MTTPAPYAVDTLIAQARRLAAEFRKVTGKPLPVSSEIAQYDASRLLDLELVHPGMGGYDAIGRGPRAGQRVQIKGRAILDEQRVGHRIGQLKLDQAWDILVLVLMDAQFEPLEIYQANRQVIEESLSSTANNRRDRRGAMSVARFKNIARLVWSRERGLEAHSCLDKGLSQNPKR